MSSSEKRKFTRVPFETAVRVSTEEVNVTSSQIRNVSLGGMFIHTTERLPIDARCKIEIDLIGPASLLRIQMEGEVIRVDPEGVAVKFTKMDMDSLIHLKHLISISAEHPEAIDNEYYKTLFEVDPPA